MTVALRTVDMTIRQPVLQKIARKYYCGDDIILLPSVTFF